MTLAAKGPDLLGVQPSKVAATGLAQLAAAFHSSVEVDDGVRKIAPAFNLALIAPDYDPAAWFEVLGRIWLNFVSLPVPRGSSRPLHADDVAHARLHDPQGTSGRHG
ncbi:hypothetical protein [Prosthecobacter sp.]|uniref:hypothetical protein n=1 Tax=Prosthecobacter sp. TaxID=1965333 RepID=UPI002ABCD74D|nr:hypothetical protein [Prosthecobacter sp.]MDZ4401188.1 hypothetical protein [Prosthecobacter sp.]